MDSAPMQDLPVPTEGTSDVDGGGASLIVCGWAKTIYKAIVGKRGLWETRRINTAHEDVLLNTVEHADHFLATNQKPQKHTHTHPPTRTDWPTYQRSFKIWRRRRCPGGGHDVVGQVLLLGAVDVLHEEGRAVLGLGLGLLGVHAAVQVTVAILRKERVDSFYSGLEAKGIGH